MIRNTTRNVALALMSAAVLSACATGGSYVQSDQYGNPTEQQNRTGRNALIGTAIGVAAGLLTGDSATERRQHALIGAGIGALSGAAVGQYRIARTRCASAPPTPASMCSAGRQHHAEPAGRHHLRLRQVHPEASVLRLAQRRRRYAA